MLELQELYELEDILRNELEDRLTEILTRLNRTGQLDQFLQLCGLENLLNCESDYNVHKNGRIIVIGQSDVKADVLLSVANKLGIEKNRVELYLNYNDAKKYDFKKIQWNPTYSAILVGPMGHSGSSKGDHSSVIAAIETAQGYPPIIRLGTNSLKISKSNFKSTLQDLLNAGVII